MGMNQKVVLGGWFKPAFQALRAMRGLRGTRWDVFGYAHVRRLERQLVDEYRSTIEAILPKLDADHLALVVELAGLPDQIRGYEQVKLRNVERYEARRRELAETLAERSEPRRDEVKTTV
jgi:indolepyruvate ferredoxin oxidoreductase